MTIDDERIKVLEAIKAFRGEDWAKGVCLAGRTDMKDDEIQFYMGLCCETGNGIKRDYAKALEWYKKSAAQGYAKAMRNIGKMYEDSPWAEPNIELAVEWYVDAARKGDAVAKKALDRIASTNMYAIVKCAEKAFDEENWEKGVFAALQTTMTNGILQMWLGYCYDNGYGVEKNLKEAFKWCEKAALKGYHWSMNRLGEMYESGRGAEKNLKEAFKWYKDVAERGYSRGQFNLGDMYEFGKGTKKNRDKAVFWYKKAIVQGYDEAQDALDRIEAEIEAEKWDDPFFVLEHLIGLKSVKEQVKEIIDSAKAQKMREERGLPKVDMSYHCVFTGNPGTGKTTVARLYAKILYELGIVKTDNFVEADRSKLLDTCYGGTEKKTAKVIEKALDGVLFIDEAYTLYKENDEYDNGREAINTLLKQMEDNRDRLVVIVAGYTKKMEAFLDANEGVRSRFPNTIHFPDYSASELVEVFKLCAKKGNFFVDNETLAAVRAEAEFALAKREEGFGNARFIRTLFEKAVRIQSRRIVALENPSDKELQHIIADDIPDDSGRNGLVETVDDILKELDNLVGLKPVKEDIRKLSNYIQIQKLRKEAGLPISQDASYHCVFTGNPGTGKTTVANYMARIYRALGIIRTTNLVQADRSQLVAGYIGQTALKTDKVIDSALNGVLFIDEAYALSDNTSNSDFGHEAVSTLIKRMEDDRDRLVVIVAGYTNEMRNFINMNPGLQSRFTRYIDFPDYSEDELVEIFARKAKKEEFILGDGVLEAVRGKIHEMCVNMGKSFGNARAIRQFYLDVKEHQSARLVEERHATKELLSTIIYEDVRNSSALREGGLSEKKVPAPTTYTYKTTTYKESGDKASKRRRVSFDGEITAVVTTWKEAFLAAFEKLNEMFPEKFDSLPDNPYFRNYFVRVEPGRRYSGYLSPRFGVGRNIRVKELVGKSYAEREDYYFLRMLTHFGLAPGRLVID